MICPDCYSYNLPHANNCKVCGLPFGGNNVGINVLEVSNEDDRCRKPKEVWKNES